MSNIKKFLQQIKSISGKEFYEFILKEGYSLKTRKLLQKEREKIIKQNSVVLRRGCCYYNAQQLTIYSEGKVDYYEGYAIPKSIGIPIEHAWNGLNGNFIDITWKDGIEYFGVKFPYEWIKKQFYKFAFKHNFTDSHLIRYWEYQNKKGGVNNGKNSANKIRA